MLQSMRDKAKSWVTIVIVAIIAFMMAITGLETLTPNRHNPTVASVNGEDISHAQLTQALERQRQMLIQRMGGQFDPSIIDSKVFKKAVLQSLIDRALELQDAEKNGMEIGNKSLEGMIVSMPEFQNKGTFDQARFKMLVRNAGMTPAQFKSMFREESLLVQLRAGLSASDFVTNTELKSLNALENQTREITWMVLPVEAVREGIKPSENEIKAYFEQHKSAYMTPEEVAINYIELDKAKLADSINISDEELRQEYQDHIDTLKSNAKDVNTVSSILIAVTTQRPDAEAKKRAETVLNRIKKGESFFKLAQEFSDDPATAKKGGNMGMIKNGFYGSAFDNAVKKLQVGKVSNIIKTSYGYQIIKVTKRQQVKLPTFAELKGNIVSSLKEQAVENIYLNKSRQLADISFEASDLVQPAEKLGLSIKTTKAFSRNGGEGLTADPKIISASFSDEVLNLGANSEVIEISPGKSLVLRVKEHYKSKLRSLDDVKASIVAIIKKEKAEDELKKKAQQLISEIQTSNGNNAVKKSGLSWKEDLSIHRRQQGIPRQIVTAAFSMPHPENNKPSLIYKELPNGDVAIISLLSISPGKYTEADKSKLASLSKYIAEGYGQYLFNEYLQSLKSQGDIKIKEKGA